MNDEELLETINIIKKEIRERPDFIDEPDEVVDHAILNIIYEAYVTNELTREEFENIAYLMGYAVEEEIIEETIE